MELNPSRNVLIWIARRIKASEGNGAVLRAPSRDASVEGDEFIASGHILRQVRRNALFNRV
jgi:hypothetical protein